MLVLYKKKLSEREWGQHSTKPLKTFQKYIVNIFFCFREIGKTGKLKSSKIKTVPFKGQFKKSKQNTPELQICKKIEQGLSWKFLDTVWSPVPSTHTHTLFDDKNVAAFMLGCSVRETSNFQNIWEKNKNEYLFKFFFIFLLLFVMSIFLYDVNAIVLNQYHKF